MKYVIIGNGVAGITAAETIRNLDGQGGITLISDETAPPYSRPMISLVLEGALSPEQILIRDSHFYERLNIEPVLGSRVTSIDPENRLVVLDETDRGKTKQSYAFDRLLIASGADPRGIRAEGLDLGGIYSLRNLDQVSQMEQGLQPRQKALVLGGGLVGFKAAYALLQRGLQVTMLIKSDYPLSMQLDPQAGRLVQDELSARGLDVRLGTEVRAFEGKKRLQAAHLDDGSRIECDLAVIGKGVLPALSFIPRDKISLDLGIRVDDSLQTSVPGIYAAGDVAEHRDIARGTPWVNAIWPEAAA